MIIVFPYVLIALLLTASWSVVRQTMTSLICLLKKVFSVQIKSIKNNILLKYFVLIVLILTKNQKRRKHFNLPNIIKKRSLGHPVFPSGHPSKY